jgi:hypothetical protein
MEEPNSLLVILENDLECVSLLVVDLVGDMELLVNFGLPVNLRLSLDERDKVEEERERVEVGAVAFNCESSLLLTTLLDPPLFQIFFLIF